MRVLALLIIVAGVVYWVTQMLPSFSLYDDGEVRSSASQAVENSINQSVQDYDKKLQKSLQQSDSG